MNEFIEKNRQEIAHRLIMLGQLIGMGRNTNSFIVDDHLISLTIGPIRDIETLNAQEPNHSGPDRPTSDEPGIQPQVQQV